MSNDIAKMPPRMITKADAAEYCGVGVERFIGLIAEGKLPGGLNMGTHGLRWDRKAIDLALDRLSGLATHRELQGIANIAERLNGPRGSAAKKK